MTVTKQYLERKVRDNYEWLQKHPVSHPMYKLTEANQKYYIKHLEEMDRLGLNQIELKRYKK